MQLHYKIVQTGAKYMSKITARECRFATHIPSKHPDNPDIHMVKEILHLEDGTTKSNIRYIKDFQRDFYVTLPNMRTHKQKKETEHLDNLRKYTCTQSQLRDTVAKALDKSWSHDYLKKLSVSPYLYGSDISSTSLIKQAYKDKFPDTSTMYSVSVLDIETDVVNGTDDILMITLTTDKTIYTVVVESFLSGINNPEEAVKKATVKYINNYLDDKTLTVQIEPTPHDAIKNIFKHIHELMPDWVAIWNIDFDLPNIIKALEKAGIEPKTVFNDPGLPDKYKYFKYKQGRKKKVTSSGKVTPINPAAQWHTTDNHASFQFIDAMCVYKQIRMGRQEEPSYALDAILDKELGIRKLKFAEADSYTGLKWHQFMQSKYKLEYVVYNMFDCISINVLDNKTKDLCSTLPIFSGASDFSDFNSQPKRIVDGLHFFTLDSNEVMATAGFEDNEDEEAILDLTGWIVTLPSHMCVLGRACIKEDPMVRTGLRLYVYDSDVVGAYPHCVLTANVSKGTTAKEIIKIKGIPENVFRIQNLNFLMGRSNSLEYSTTMFKLPKPDDILSML